MKRRPLRGLQPQAQSALDSLGDHIAVLDHSGSIVTVNSAWREFAVANGAAGANVSEGADYFDTCSRAKGDDAEAARAFAAGIRDVFAGQRKFFELEYPCHSPDQFRWFIGRVTPFRGTGDRLVVVAHVDITERRLAEGEARDLADRLSFVSRRVIEIQEEERRRVARELHEEIAQVLSAISLNLHSVKGVCDAASLSRIEESILIVEQATSQVRKLSLDLRPSMLDDLGLVATLRWFADRQAQRAGFIMHFSAESSAAHMPADLTINCFRVVQEALTNVIRHGRARHVWIELRQGDDKLDLAIRDDGVGFDPDNVLCGTASGQEFGLLGIQQRVEQLGGRADIRSQPGHGTTIRVWFPMAGDRSTS